MVKYKKLDDQGKMRFARYRKLVTPSELFTESIIQYHGFIELFPIAVEPSSEESKAS